MAPRVTTPVPNSLRIDDDALGLSDPALSLGDTTAADDLAVAAADLARREANLAAREAALALATGTVGTSDGDALANSAKLGPSARAAPVGMPVMARIILEETDGMAPNGQPFSLNGRAYMIQPGVEVTVPLGLLEVIDNAVGASPIVDPQTLKVVGHRPRLRFPYRRLPDRAA